MNTWKDISKGIKSLDFTGNPVQQVLGITADSREVKPGYVFFAVRGTISDGHSYISKAIENGAVIVVCEDAPVEGKAMFCTVEDSKEALGIAASNFQGNPSGQLSLVGVTGTNGKTSVCTLLYRLFSELGYKTGLISTVEYKIGNQTISSTHTTPDPVKLNRLLGEMVEAGCDYVFMEVSSHAVDQRRIAGLHFKGGIFTNITHDHLDYHGTFAEYLKAKKRFFDDLPKDAFALTNIDDKRGNVMLQNTEAKKYPFALKRAAAFKAKIIDNSINGLQLDLDGTEFHGRLIGEFNAYNYLAAYGAAMLLNMDRQEVMTIMSNLQAAEGRFDYLYAKDSGRTGIVDYAHTPDALEKVLETINSLKEKGTKVITVVGCGGDRDKTKRPIMAKMATVLSDRVILTSDNPRSENPETIIYEMEGGIPIMERSKVLSITDRRQAIKTACALAQSGDIILVAGKGHEKYQEINGEKFPFDDKEVLEEYLYLSEVRG